MKRSILAAGWLMLAVLATPAATVIVNPWTPIFKGIDVASGQQIPTLAGERTLQLMCYRVDLNDPDVVLFTTPKCTNCGTADTLAQNTSHFLEQYGVQIAVNGGFYNSGSGPGDVPLGTPEDVRGLAISLGNIVSPADDTTRAATLLFNDSKQPTLIPNNNPPVSTVGIHTAISGDKVLLTNGVVAQAPIPADVDPRTAIGYSEDRRFLYLMTLDGRQPGWSDGADWATTGQWLKNFGAYEGINVDGGGSTTMAMQNCQGRAQRLNRPSFLLTAAARERYVGHNFGVYAAKLPSTLKNLETLPSQTTANITWETEEPGTTQVEYGLTTAYGSATPLDARPKRKHVATLTSLAQGTNYFFRAISSTIGGSSTQECQFATTTANSYTELFPLTQVWKYTSNNLDGVNWKTAAYNDSSWMGQGPGLLYVLESNAAVGPKNTAMPPLTGTTLPRTYYFRTRFNFSGSTAGVSLLFSNYVDDGAVFYLNGTEVRRLRMQVGIAISNATAANGTPCTTQDATCPDVFTIGASNLVQGENIVAVEVHNANQSDLVFGSALLAIKPASVVPTLNIVSENEVSTLFWNEEGFRLQQSSDLNESSGWSDVAATTPSPMTVTNIFRTYYRLRN